MKRASPASADDDGAADAADDATATLRSAKHRRAEPLRYIYDHPDLYDHEYRQWRDDIHFYCGIAAEFLGGPAEILELGCGTGRLTLELARDGHHVFACDLSAEMLRQAQRNLRDADDLEDGRVHLFRADMRTVTLRRRVPMVLCCFNSLEHLYRNRDVLACLARVREALAHDGLFVFDVHNPDPRVLASSPKKVWGRDTFRTSDGWMRRTLTSHYRQIEQLHDITCRYQPLAEDKATPTGPAFSQKLTQRKFWPQELLSLLELAGFEIRMRLGEFDHSPLRDDSVSQILVCQPTVRAKQ
jgi:SAM-dependent methyltransferase